MCKIVQTKKIDQSFVTKVFAQLSTYLGFSSTKNFIELHFPYIFHEWIKMKYSLEDFPFMILDAESLDAFIVEFFKNLVPVLFLLEELPSISEIAEKLKTSNSELIYSCLPTIQAHIISGFAVETLQIDSNKAEGVLNTMIPAEDCVQNIFLALRVILSKALRPHEGRHVLFMYKIFLELLCPELGPGLNCSCFVVKEITYTIINFLTSVRIDTAEDEIIVIYCCDILQLLCSNALPYFKENEKYFAKQKLLRGITKTIKTAEHPSSYRPKQKYSKGLRT
ncbi:hypothetical protein TNCV_2784381 [Trichonephila clavipes]|nr:hypothetical protein TNCV_2784381 [Trichonephila clavipes]